MLFSQRYGLKPIKQIIQTDDIDNELKNKLWNILGIFHFDKLKNKLLVERNIYGETRNNPILPLINSIWNSYFKQTLDSVSNDGDIVYKELKNYFFNCPWYEVYDFIEFILSNANNNTDFIKVCNHILEQELSGYRFINGHFSKISSEAEIESIEQAIQNTDKFNGASIHLKTALKFLSDRKAPDYRNSIKESISAVESACIIISGDNKATLGKALRIIEDKHPLHGSLKGAFEKLYGYTSDTDGIRHALLDESHIKFEDAKFMLVSCSAFVNYLISKNKDS